MFPNPDLFSIRVLCCLLAAAAVLSGCSAVPASPVAKAGTQRLATQPSPDPEQASTDVEVSPPRPSQPAANLLVFPRADATANLLAFADRIRLLPPAQLAQEAARLGDVAAPVGQLQLALVLSQSMQLPELLRAQELLGRVLGNASAEAQALHPLARLLAARYGDQRRLEEQLERQTQQLHDLQRKLDQTHERLEALKAIERSLTSRPPAVPAPAANRTHPKTP
jgi:hypothetical protein